MTYNQDLFKNKLNNFVNNTSTLTDLIPILSLVHITDIKSFICNTINNYSENQVKNIFHSTQSIEEILPDDITEYILSFNLKNDIIAVSKSFQNIALNNEQRLLKHWINNKINKQIIDDNSDINKQFFLQQMKYLYIQQTQRSIYKTIEKYQNKIKILQQNNSKLDRNMKDISLKKHRLLQTCNEKNKLTNHTENIPEFPTKYCDGFNDTWIVHKTRKILTKQETLLGYTKLVNHPMIAVQKAKSGDKILIYPHAGTWTYFNECNCSVPENYDGSNFECDCPLSFPFEVENKDLQIIGLENKHNNDKVIFEDNGDSDDHFFCIKRNCNILMKNICINSENESHQPNGAINAYGCDNSLWLKDCIIRFGEAGVVIGEMSNLYVLNSTFLGGNGSSMAIWICGYAHNISICNCLFSHCGNEGKYMYIGENGCVEIMINEEYWDKYREQPCVELKCVANTFCDNYGYPICIRSEIECRDWINVRKFECLLKDNKLKGYNGIHVNETVSNANILYDNQQPCKLDD